MRAANAGDVDGRRRLRPRATASTSPSAAAATACPGSARATAASSSTCRGMRGVRVDPAARTARAEGGATWGDFNAATHAFGLATTGGIISTTGVGGLTLGGGIGYLARGFGLSLRQPDLGRRGDRRRPVRRRQRERERGPVLGAPRRRRQLRRRAPRSSSSCTRSTTIYGGPMFFELEDAGDVLRFYREFIADAPEAVRRRSRRSRSRRRCRSSRRTGTATRSSRSSSCWAGPLERGRGGARSRSATSRRWSPSTSGRCRTRRSTARSTRSSRPGSSTTGRRTSSPSSPTRRSTRTCEHGPKVPAVNSTVHIYPINGACHRVAADATAFAYRDANFATVIAGMWPDPADNEANIKWVRDYYDATAPHVRARRLRQLHGRRRPGPDQGELRRQLRPAGRGQAARTTRTTCST